jgi:periplasmic protein CpxP/Spy
MFNTFLKGTNAMKTWISRSLLGALGVALLAGSLTACGARGEHGRDGMSAERITETRGKLIDKVGRKLELNDAQKQKLGVLADEMIAARAELRGPGANPRAELQALVAGAQFDRSRAQALLDQKTQVVQARGPKMVAAMGDFYDSLNPEQQKEVRERMNKRGGWWHRD